MHRRRTVIVVATPTPHGDMHVGQQAGRYLATDVYARYRYATGHGADVVSEVPRDLVRFYLALTSPERLRTVLSRELLAKVTSRRLVDPWNALADRLAEDVAPLPPAGPLPVTEAGTRLAADILERFRHCYELSSMSLAWVADALITQLIRVRDAAERGDLALGDVLLAARTLLACAGPILMDTAAQAAAYGVDVSIDDPGGVTEIRPFRLPRLRAAGEPAVEDAEPPAGPGPARRGLSTLLRRMP